jgi:F5/8 type C domain
MPPTAPLLLVDNVYDTVTLYPTGTVATSNERVGNEGYRVASYRRERASWQTSTTAASHWVQVDLGATVSRDTDFIVFDRGHNLWGRNVSVQYSADGITWSALRAFLLPAAGTLGGDPTTNTGAVTEEGAWWALFAPSGAPRRFWRVIFPDTIAPIVTGLVLGLRSQLLGFSNTFDEDAGERTEASSTSTAGYRASEKTYSWRTLELGLAYIGAVEYDATIRSLRGWLFDRNQPAVIFMDYGTRPERGWMYQYDGRAWAAAKTRVYRSGRFRFRELGASLG